LTFALSSGKQYHVPVSCIQRGVTFEAFERVRVIDCTNIKGLSQFNGLTGTVDSKVPINVSPDARIDIMFEDSGKSYNLPIQFLIRVESSSPQAQQLKVPLKRSKTATNEFSTNKQLLTGAFPCFFALGNGPAREGTLSTADARHLLLQYQNQFATFAPLHFLLFNQLQRHTGASRLAASVRNNDDSFKRFVELYQNEDTIKNIDDALLNPSSARAVVLLRKFEKIFKVMNALIPFSSAARKSQLGQFVASYRHFGAAQCFVTTAPDRLSSPITLRMTYPTQNNRDFPAVDGGFLEKLKIPTHDTEKSGTSDTSIPSKAEFTKRVTENPVASAECFSQETDATCEILFGLKESSSTRKTMKQEQKSRGVFGFLRSFFGVHETTGKGFMHSHYLLSLGIPPWVIQTIGGYNNPNDVDYENSDRLQAALAEYLDAMIQAQLGVGTHVQSLLRQLFAMHPYPAPWFAEDIIDKTSGKVDFDKEKFRVHVNAAVARTNIHKHNSRCYKGDWGKTQCAQCYRQALLKKTQSTHLVLDDLFTSYDPEHTTNNAEFRYDIRPRGQAAPIGDFDDSIPMSHEDRRVIVVESARPELKPEYLKQPDGIEETSDHHQSDDQNPDENKTDECDIRKADLEYFRTDEPLINLKYNKDEYDPFPPLTDDQGKLVKEVEDPTQSPNVEAAQVASTKVKSSLKILQDAFKWHTHDRNDNAFDLHCALLSKCNQCLCFICSSVS
jgi:hypothetical protein